VIVPVQVIEGVAIAFIMLVAWSVCSSRGFEE